MRFGIQLPEFFINFLPDQSLASFGDLVGNGSFLKFDFGMSRPIKKGEKPPPTRRMAERMRRAFLGDIFYIFILSSNSGLVIWPWATSLEMSFSL